MRKIIIALCVFGLAACSSTPETTDTTEPTVTDTTATTETTTTTTTTTTTEPDTTTAVSADAGGNAENTNMEPVPEGGAFPPIEGTEKATATCLRSNDTRIVSVLDRTGGGCGTVYTKHGDKQTVAMANYDMNYCEKVFENIKGNLAGAGFDCGGGAAAPAPEANDGDSKDEGNE